MAGVRYKDAGTMKGFKSPERISCYAHAFSKESAEPQESEEGKSSAFGQGDGEINFAERGGRWYVPEGEIGGFSCLLLSS